MTTIEELLKKKIEGTLTAEESILLQEWAERSPTNQSLLLQTADDGFIRQHLQGYHELAAHDEEPYSEKLFTRVNRQLKQTHTSARFLQWIAVAACLLVIGGVYFFSVRELKQPPRIVAADIPPGSNRAMLTLADGRIVDLSEAQTGIVVGDGITYTDGTEVFSPEVSESGSPEDSQHAGLTTYDLRLTTPKGGQYQITLPDGTKVWLNTASTLTYPSRFTGNTREVKIEGEGYFEVSPDKARPFSVHSKGQEIRVLGTEFNIRSYTDENETKTTLVSGGVKVINRLNADRISDEIPLLPHEQSVLTSSGSLAKQNVNPAVAISWKSGRFYFENTPVDDMMRQIERWYDITVVYKNKVPDDTFSGVIERNVSLNTLLEFLGESGLSFALEGKTLIIK